MIEHTKILEKAYKEANILLRENKGKAFIPKSINAEQLFALNNIIKNCENRKAVLTVLITSLCHKIFDPKQDIRIHQSNLKKGYSGRTLDTKFITPFMKGKKFPAMVESGWLTRSFEQNSPYDLKYRGKITPKDLKKSFLSLINDIETKNSSPYDFLIYLFGNLIILRETNNIKIIRVNGKSKFTINQIIHFIEDHFKKSSVVGTARLPVLAIYSVYECMINELKRFENKKLLPLGSHTSADYRSGDIGDIEVINEESMPFEGVEIKYGKQITAQMVKDAFEKFKQYPVNRYYLLSTVSSADKELIEITKFIEKITEEHGCQIIVNGIMDSLKYYLRLLNDTDKFLDCYGANLQKDPVIKAEQKKLWNEILKSAKDNE